jgi:hypothetical protein
LLNATMNCRTPIFLSHQEDAFHHITSLQLGCRSREDDLPHSEGIDAVGNLDKFMDLLLDEFEPVAYPIHKFLSRLL